MGELSTFQLNDVRRLFEMAKRLEKEGFFDHHLTLEQRHILRAILERDNFELWRQFVDGNCTLAIAKTDGDDDDSEIAEGPGPLMLLALQVRYLLWEKAIDFFYTHGSDNNSIAQELEVAAALPAAPPEEKKKAVRDEEEDYDDDDDDDNDDDKAEEQAGQAAAASNTALAHNGEGLVVLELARSEFPRPEAEANEEHADNQENTAGALEEQEATIKNFNKVYHNFEYDRGTLLKKRKLDKSDMQLESQKAPENADVPINLGPVSHLLKHLLHTIQERRDDISLNDLELRTLFMDVRKNRGKWANDERVGQEELYDACEKVLLDLRGYTEHLTPFLNKVSKREAPNYGLVIKKPMDLNTVMKNLKGLAYLSKQEFVDDLMLIWNNCLAYNSNPKHYLRVHALAMQKRTHKLISTIPNIVIKNRADIEHEDDADDKTATPGAGKKASKKGRMRRAEEEVKQEVEDGVAPVSAPAEAAHHSPAPEEDGNNNEDNDDDNDNNNNNNDNNDDDNEMRDADDDNEMRDADDEPEMRDGDDEDQDADLIAWKNLTATSRASYCASRAALFDEHGHLKMDAEALVRELGKMKNFNQFLEFKEVVSKGNQLLDLDEPYLLEYDIVGGVPGLAYRGVDDAAQEKYEDDMAEAIAQNPDSALLLLLLLVLPEDKGLNRLYRDNITEIQEIRKVCFKISLIRQMQTQAYMHRTQMRQPEIEYLREVDVDPVSRLPNHDVYTGPTQFAALRRSVAKTVMHTGFETTEPFAINTLTQVAEKYLLNLARAIKTHCESHSSNQLDDREIVLLALLENGVDKPDDLYTFIQERAVKHQKKLRDLRSKLSGFLKDLLRPSLESFNEKSFEDNSEQFTTGDFTSDLGDDFFGFKELGLDKEFKMLTSSIPINLLHSRLQSSLTNADSATKSTKYEDLRDFATPKLTAADIKSQIGLLQPFYNNLVERTEAHYLKQQKRNGEIIELPPPHKLYLLEDDDLPQKQRNIRPRLPPTGKITSVKKRLLLNAYVLPEEEVKAEVEEGNLEGDFESGFIPSEIPV